jgi:hypothetical protein
MSVLQFRDEFVAYGFISIGIGTSILGIAFLFPVVLKKRKA